MKKVVLMLIFVIAINCVFAQMQQMNNQIHGKDIVSEKLIFLQKHSLFNNYKQPIMGNKKTLNAMSLQTSTKWQMDTLIVYDTIPNDTLGQKYGRLIQTFDVSGNVLTNKTEAWEDNAWVNYFETILTYDANGNVLTVLYEESLNNAWVNFLKVLYTYDANGNVLTCIYEEWQSNAWVNYEMYTYTYDTNGNILTNLFQKWENNAWLNSSIDTYTYDANGDRLTDLLETWQSNVWVNSDSTTYTYSNGKMLTGLYEGRQNNSWVVDSMSSYIYDANGNVLLDLTQLWKTNYYANYTKDTIIYDANGNMLTYLTEVWNNDVWVNSVRYIYTYDANGNSITGKCEVWNNSTWKPGMNNLEGNFWIYSQKKPISYDGIITSIYRYEAHWIAFNAGINQLTNYNKQLTIYPNPANEIVNINFPGYSDYGRGFACKALTKIELYSITGELIRILPIQSTLTQVSISDLSKGVYIIKVQSSEFGVINSGQLIIKL